MRETIDLFVYLFDIEQLTSNRFVQTSIFRWLAPAEFYLSAVMHVERNQARVSIELSHNNRFHAYTQLNPLTFNPFTHCDRRTMTK